MGQVGQEPVEEQEKDGDQARADQSGQLGPGTGLVGHRRARATDRDRKTLEEPCRDIRRADADHLLIGSTSSPCRAAKLAAVAIVSVSDTIVMPTAPTRRGPTSDHLVHGSEGVGIP